MCGGDSDPGVCSGPPYAGADKDSERLFGCLFGFPAYFLLGVCIMAFLQMMYPLRTVENTWLAACYAMFDISLLFLYWTKAFYAWIFKKIWETLADFYHDGNPGS